MGPSAKAAVALLFVVLSVVAAIAWGDAQISVLIDISLTIAALLALSLLVWATMRRDKAPDFLYRLVGRNFECNGFAFAVVPRVDQGICQLAILFQNRYANPCEAQVNLKPSRGFFMLRRAISQLSIGIICDGGAFGVAFVPWGIPLQYQGKKQDIDVGASVRFPKGKGELLRFRDGIEVKGPTLEAVRVALTVAGAVGGHFMIDTPARQSIRLPTDVAETVPDESPITVVTLWRPGDPTDRVETFWESSA
jgi:hypothetical protein